MRILIVENEVLVALMLADSLEDAAHEVIGPAATASEALVLCEAVCPDMALLDSNLRDCHNGVDLGRSIFDRWGLLIIFASAQAVEARRARDITFGYISKPYVPETVLRSVEPAHVGMNGGKPTHVPKGFELYHPSRDPIRR